MMPVNWVYTFLLLPSKQNFSLSGGRGSMNPPIKGKGKFLYSTVFKTTQSALHFTSLAHLFNQTPSQLLWEASSHMLQLMCEGCSYTYPPLYVARYSFIQLSELEQCKHLPKVLMPQHRIRTRVLVVKSPMPYP